MNEFKSDWISLSQSFVQNGWIQDGRIQDGCHHQVRWEWMSLSQIELVWFRVRVEWECFWAKLREDNKVSEDGSGWIQHGRIKDGCHHQVESEKVSEVYSLQNGWIQDGRIQDGCHHQVELEWMSLSQIELDWVRVLCKMGEFKMAEFKMAAIIKLGENEWVWVRLN